MWESRKLKLYSDNTCPGPQPNSSGWDLGQDGKWNGRNGKSGTLNHSSNEIGACIFEATPQWPCAIEIHLLEPALNGSCTIGIHFTRTCIEWPCTIGIHFTRTCIEWPCAIGIRLPEAAMNGLVYTQK